MTNLNLNTISRSHYAHNRAPMNDDQLRRACPVIFQEFPHDRTSERYTMIPTIDVINGLREQGWFPVSAQQNTVRKADRQGYQRHAIRFQRDITVAPAIGDTVPELVLLNAHDATTAYQIHAGLFRFVCANGLVVADSTFDKVSVRHSGDILNDVIEGTYRVLESTDRVAEVVDDWQGIEVGRQEALAYGRAALQLRWDDDDKGNSTAPIDQTRIIAPRRFEDRGNDGKIDLWKLFNATQENLLRGNQGGYTSNGRRTRTRQVKSVSEGTKLNKAIWSLTEHFAAMMKEAA